jgi:AraC-like DNA-binding protein
MKIDHGDALSDVLTSVLNSLQFKGQVFCYSRFSAPWAIQLKRKEFALFHYIESGEAWIDLENTGDRTKLLSGDFVILPHGGPHILRDSPRAKAVNVEKLLICRDKLTLKHGGGGSETTTVCGAFTFDHQTGYPILPLLPELIYVPRERTGSGTWLESTLKLLANEAQFPREGSGSIIGHVTGIIFIQAVREWIATQAHDQSGWLGALRDKQIGSALSLMHQKPGEPWTVAKLASECGMSRSPFATKFTLLVGEPPLAYLTKWRMNLAAGYLRDVKISIREIAERVGYESQASFTNAFKRSFSLSPREYKDKHKAIGSPPLTQSASAGTTYSN